MVAVFFFFFVSMVTYGQQEGWKPTGFFSLSLQEKYIGFNLPEVFHDEPVVWSEFMLNLPEGFYVDFWHSVGLDDSDFSSNWGDEFDVISGYNGKIGDFNINFEASFFNVFPLEKWWDNDFLLFSGKLSKTINLDDNQLSFGTKIGWIADISNFENGAVFINPFLCHSWKKPFNFECLDINQEIHLLWNSGFGITGAEDLSAKYNISPTWKLAENLSLVAPGFSLLVPFSNSEGVRGPDKSVFFSFLVFF